MKDEYAGLMNRFDQEALSFVIRLWFEHEDADTDMGEWRGWVETPDGKSHRHYFRDIGEIAGIISANFMPATSNNENHDLRGDTNPPYTDSNYDR